ncbi:MAG: aminotransferase class V-fold PLP-dependent enzyme [Acidobacteria bacterium]|nr:aminotransferase class V-fold PLP-dependent enzyme [Candidatus Sulfomarinibacter kjeldsenii]
MMIYLDHAATSFPKAPDVAEAVALFLNQAAGNPGRGGHRLTVAASRVVEGAREDVASLLGGDPERTVFGPGATFWINAVLASKLNAGDRVVTTSLEHNAVMRPLRWYEKKRRIKLVTIKGKSPDGVPSTDEIVASVTRAPTSLVIMTHASNVNGAVMPVAEVAQAVSPVPVLVDAAQTAGCLPIDFAKTGAAALVASGHKGLLGPTGIGVEAIHKHGRQLLQRLVDGFRGVPGVYLHGWNPDTPRVNILSFTMRGKDNGELAAWLDRKHGIMVRAGLHCAPSAHQRLETFPNGTIRVGIGPFNTEADIDALIEAVFDAYENGIE